MLRKEYKNLEIPADLDIEMPEEIGVYRFVQADDVLDQKERIFNEFIPKKRRQEKYYKEDSGGRTQPRGPEYVDIETGEHLYLGDTGFFNYQRNDKVENYDDTEILETIYLNRPYTEKKYRLRDGKILLSEAVKLAEEAVKRWEGIVDHDFETRVRKVDVYPSKDKGKRVLVFSFEKCYKGVNVMADIDTEEGALLSNEVLCNDDQVIVASCKGAESYLSTEGIIYKKETIKGLDQIVSLESALHQVEGKMAGQVTRIALSYLLCNPKGEFCSHEAGEEYVSKPYWVIYSCEDTGHEEYAMVDCRTGEVHHVKNNG